MKKITHALTHLRTYALAYLCTYALVIILLLSTTAHARIYIPVNQPSDQKFPIAVCDLKGSGKFSEEIPNIIRHDLELSGYFKVIPDIAYEQVAQNEDITAESIRFSFWTSIEVQGLVKGKVESESGKYIVTLRLFDPASQEMLVGKQYTFEKKEAREVAHRFSDDIMEALTGMRGVFNTKIAYTVPVKKGNKEIAIMDMDGENSHQVTKLKTISLSPSWSPAGDQLAFTSYVRGNPDLYIINTDGGGLRQIVGGGGAELTPSWSHDGSKIIFSSSMNGDAEIYATTPAGGKVTKITSANAIDIAPYWSSDNSEIVFSSERQGSLHVYKMSSSGAGVQRLTFVGYQNDMPSWSPMGDKIAFAGRDMGTFDIFIMNPDGSNIQRLTVATGSNESPTWSPDERFIAFSSTREGEPAIFLMRADGSNQTRISKGAGQLPEWGPRVQ